MGTVRGFFFFSSRRRHTRLVSDWSSDVCFPIWPGLTWKNRLNSFVGPTLTPGRGAPVDVDAILTSYGPAPRSGPEPILACCHGHSALTSDAVRAPRWSSSTRPSSKATTDVQSQELLDGLASADG